MENKRRKRQKIWTVIGVAIAIVLLLYWLTLAIWIDDEPEASTQPTIEQATMVNKS